MLKEDGGALTWRIDRACTTPALGSIETFWSGLRAVPCPTLPMRGESDILSPDMHARMTAASPNGHPVVIPGAAHMVIDENEQGVVDAAASFLDRHYLKAKAA